MNEFKYGLTKYVNGSPSKKPWLELQYNDSQRTKIKKPHELEKDMKEPPKGSVDEKVLDQIQGSIIGMALGDALGAHVEFHPRQYLLQNEVKDLEGGGTWGLQKGQFTDDTSMALCLANSLVTKGEFNPYDQLVRYKWWWRNGYMSSTGECFDIGKATKESIETFCGRQAKLIKNENIPETDIDYLDDPQLLAKFDVMCSQPDVAGNGALMRLAPVPLFFFRHPEIAVEYSGISGEITHGDIKAYDACRYYAALIVATIYDCPKKLLLSEDFYARHEAWFGGKPLCPEIQQIADGSFKRKRGYDDGIRGKGYIVDALEAALWAFWSDEDSFETGALNAVNLGDDTDTTAAIYGQLAGAYYGYKKLPGKWLKHVYAHKFMMNLSRWIVYEGGLCQPSDDNSAIANGSKNKQSLAEPPQNPQHDESKIPKANNKPATKVPPANGLKPAVPKPVQNSPNKTQQPPTNPKSSGSKPPLVVGNALSNRASLNAPKLQNNLHATRSTGASRNNPGRLQPSPIKSKVSSDPAPQDPIEST